MTAALANLSDVEFEDLVADLLRAETGRDHRVFRRAADGGVDVRHQGRSVLEVTQCKHFLNSTFNQLESEAKKEKKKVDALFPVPTRYRFVTSRTLTIKQVSRIAKALAPWIADENDIWDGKQIDRLLVAHDHVLRAHVKLWLGGGAALAALLRAATMQRSKALVEDVREMLPRYVQTERFFKAQRRLAEGGTCLIAGEPGIGKTTMAQMLLLDLANQGFEPLQISADVEEAWDALDEGHPQAFYYDDFLSRSAVGERLAKNEDQRLVQLIRYAAKRPRSVRLILTTREYILREATALYETFQRAGVDAKRFLLRVPDYTRQERAMILYNHIYHSGKLTQEQLDSLLKDRAYLEIIDHNHYNPRVIEYITGLSLATELPVAATEDYAAFATDALDHPDEIWRHAFENELNEHQQALLLIMASMPATVRVADIRNAFDATVDASPSAFGKALKTLEVTFLSLSRRAGVDLITFANPSVEDFLARVLSREPGEVKRLACCAIALEQLEVLWDLGRVVDEPRPSPLLADALAQHQRQFAEAVRRLWEVPSVVLSYYDASGRPSVGLVSSSLERRLTTAVRIRSLGTNAAAVLDEWLEGAITQLMERWKTVGGDGSDVIRLLRTMHTYGMDTTVERLGETVKPWMMVHASTSDDFNTLDDLRRRTGVSFTLAEWDEVQNAFVNMADDRIEWGLEDLEELEALEQVAEYLEVELGEHRLEQAREQIHEPEPDREPDEDRAAAPTVDPDADIDELFERLRG